MASACALAIFSGKNIIIICGSETPAGVSEPLFYRRGRNGKRHLQRRFLRKRGAAGTNPLRRSRATFPLLSPAVTSSPGAGEVFPQRGSQAVKFITKVLGAMRKLPAVFLPLSLGEVASRSDDGEGARRQPCFKVSSAIRNFAATQKSSPFRGSWHAVRRD